MSSPRTSFELSLRFVAPAAIGVVLLFATIYGVVLPGVRSHLTESRRDMSREITHVALSLLHDYEQRVQDGELSREEAQAQAVNRLRELRYGPEGKDYFWINDLGPRMIMHPYRPDLEGQDLSEFRDPDGKQLFVEFVRTVDERGAGYVDYLWQWKDDGSRVVPKSSYVEEFKPWGWIVGTGMYTEDVERRIDELTRDVNRALAVVLGLVTLLTAWLVVQATRSERRRSQADADLRASEQRLHDIIEFLPDATFGVDTEGRVIAWNKAMEALTGEPADNVLGRGDLEHANLFYGERRPTLVDLMLRPDPDYDSFYRSMERGRDQLSAETSSVGPDGLEHHLHCRVSVLRDSDGRVAGAIESIRDITARRQAENEREELREQLLQAQKMEAVGQLAGGIAHDFNNILHAVLGYTELAQVKLPADNPVHDHLEAAKGAAERAARLTRQLLAFSRRQAMTPVPTDLVELVADHMRMLGRVIGEDIELVVQPSEGPCVAEADGVMVEQVLLNLCLNSRHAMPEGGRIEIEVAREVLDEDFLARNPWGMPGQFVRLTVRDHGTGMPPEVLHRVFEPFFTTRPDSGGTGLGLAVVYGVVKQHEGFVHVDSKLGEGSSFHVYLPAASEVAAVVDEPPAPAPGSGGETILLAEDHDEVRDLAARVLRESGYEVLTARDGAEAVELFGGAADTIELVILDVVMPRMGGWEAGARIREIRPEARLLYCSGYAAEASPDSVPEGTRLLYKPVAPQALLRAVREELDR